MPISWSWLWPWQPAAPVLKNVHVVLYTRHGCHLCDQAWKVLQDAQKRFSFVLESVDVDSNGDLAARHGDCVPVVTVDGKLRFRGGVCPVLLARLLRAEAARQALYARSRKD